MTIGETLKKFITAPNYNEVRKNVDDSFIELVKELLPSDYEYIEEKEKAYQESLKQQ
jgi:hypothetical protein